MDKLGLGFLASKNDKQLHRIPQVSKERDVEKIQWEKKAAKDPQPQSRLHC